MQCEPWAPSMPLPGPSKGLLTHLGREQRVGVELAQLGHERVVRVDNVLHEAAGQHKPVGAAVHHDACRDLPLAQAPHVRVTLMKEPVQSLFLDEPVGGRPAVAEGHAGRGPGSPICLRTSTPLSVTGLEAS